MVNHRPYFKGSAAYSLSMLLYYLLHVFYYNRVDPAWLSEAFFQAFALPGVVALTWLPLSIQENTYRHFLKYSLYVLLAFSLFCMITNKELIIFKRYTSYAISCGIMVAFLVLFLKLKSYKADIL